MSYNGTNVSDSAYAFTRTDHHSRVMHRDVTLNPGGNPGFLTGKEIEKLSASQKVHEKPLSLLGQRALSLIHPSSIGSCIVYAGSPILSGINYDYARLWYTLLRCPTSTTSILSSWSEMLLIKR